MQAIRSNPPVIESDSEASDNKDSVSEYESDFIDDTAMDSDAANQEGENEDFDDDDEEVNDQAMSDVDDDADVDYNENA